MFFLQLLQAPIPTDLIPTQESDPWIWFAGVSVVVIMFLYLRGEASNKRNDEMKQASFDKALLILETQQKEGLAAIKENCETSFNTVLQLHKESMASNERVTGALDALVQKLDK